ncbi:uncharacterized protein L199_003015 [Kwoniella botswanensis]|uniref:uncharacterized protein n=1 Tax=Kwoniella botswanensis TaxID=1268659 RepID=UPI00315D7655
MSSPATSTTGDDGSTLKVYGNKLTYREVGSDDATTYDYAGSFYVARGDDHISHKAESGDITITFFKESPGIPLPIPSTALSNRLMGRSNPNIPLLGSRPTGIQSVRSRTRPIRPGRPIDPQQIDWSLIDLPSISVPIDRREPDLVLRYKPSRGTDASSQISDAQPDMTLYTNNLELGDHRFSFHKELSTHPGHSYDPRSCSSISGGSIGIGYICHDGDESFTERMEVYKPNSAESVGQIITAIGTFHRTLPRDV